MTQPAQKEVWLTLDVNGVPSGSVQLTEATARIEARHLDATVPQWAPYRVQQYVVAERVTSTQDWYASRWRRLDKLVREEATEEFKTRWFNVMANGTAEVTEGHEALDDLMPRVMQLQHSLSLANQAFGALLTGVRKGDTVLVGTVMQAIIGALQTEDGAAVVRYCGHLERLLTELRAEVEFLKSANDVQHENFAEACAALGIIPAGERWDSFTLREKCEKKAPEFARFKEAAAALRPFASEHGAVLCEHAEPAAGNEIRMSHLKAAREAYQAAFPEEH